MLISGSMSPSPNRSSQMPNSSPSEPVQSNEPGVDLSAELPKSAEELQKSPQPDQTAPCPDSSVSDSDSDENEDQLLNGQSRLWHPIPPPSEPRQYRAIGLIRGRYTASQDQFTQGILLTADGTVIDAVLLGRVMSLVKKHIDLEQEHLWVVYPRTRQKEENLHVQIMGVWEPETLKKEDEDEESSDTSETPQTEQLLTPTQLESNALSDIEHGYFSIRGEVVYQSQDEEKYVIVKIRQSSKGDQEKPKFFKLKLDGMAGPKVVGHFCDMHVQLEQDCLVIQESHDIGMIPVKKGRRPFPDRGGSFRGGGDRRDNFSRSSRPPVKPRTASSSPPRSQPISKPIKPKPKTEG